MPAAIVFSYGRPWAGREKMAFEAFQDAIAFFGKRAVEGLCDTPIAYMPPAGGGMMIVHGDRARLLEIIEMEEFLLMYLRAGFAVPDLTYQVMAAGDTAIEQMGRWAGVGSEMGLI